MESKKTTIAYMRVSTSQQSHRSQKPDIDRWLTAQDPETIGPVKWLTDKSTGRNGDRPGYKKMMDLIDRGEVSQIVTWRLDRISRSVADLQGLLKKLKSHKVNLISLHENIDLKTASGRLLVNILGSIAEFESGLRSERILSGQAAARERGVRWGGSEKGRLAGISEGQAKLIVKLKAEGQRITDIAKSVGVHRTSCYRILRNYENNLLIL